MKRYHAWLIIVVFVVLLFVFMKPIERYADALIYAPWAYGWDSRGDLTIDWTASLPDGRSLDLALARETGSDGMATSADGADARLVGSGQLCQEGGETALFALQGSSNRSGSRVRLLFLQPEAAVGQLDGEWSGETLEVAGTLFDKPLEVVLRQGSACS